VCEEFGGYPAQAIKALDDDDGLIFRVMALRSFAKAHAALEAAARAGKEVEKPTPIMKQVLQLQFELHKQRP